ncbi:uncharacterized protein TNCV_4927441 [Trichonephila clavipes]|nr:uncharacterized protein TNCV_4927441 [Trichonephila clavipes]
MCIAIHKQKFSTHGAPKQTYMLFQNDIPIDVACHRYTENMNVSSGTKNNSSSNEPLCTTVTVSFCGVLLVVPGALHIKVRRESDYKLNLHSLEKITQDHCCGLHNACSLLQVNRRRKSVAVSGTYLTGQRAYRPICPERLYMVCLETVVPVAEKADQTVLML